MLGLLARVIIGAVAVGAAGAAGYAVYKLVTRDKIKEEVKEKLADKDSDLLKKAFAAKVKEKQNDIISLAILDEFDENIENMDIHGDEIADDISSGDIISLVD